MNAPKGDVTLELSSHWVDASYERARASLIAYNEAILGVADIRSLAVHIRSRERGVVGGLWGRTSFRWLFVDVLFVPEDLRDRGAGSELLQLAEAEAIARGCAGAWLDTFSAAASNFYRKRGYEEFGRIDNYPPGATRFFLRKRFQGASP